MYEVPYFLEDYVLSNDMCAILCRLLHQQAKHRFQSLAELKAELVKLRDNIHSTPAMLRRILGHPLLAGESGVALRGGVPKTVEFKSQKLNEFSLKYLAKFVYEHNVEQLSVNGGPMPFGAIKQNSLVELNLRDSGLYSEDLFVLA